ncbi:phenolphthiocerol synthesis polyketide synthase type I Pks15/1 [Folsomia candida]|uniref:phenolphthiocerol synthesis polyketide synthase type I Pks15/1 n=1 Tax=Folsomia candida TaxID=158441 RepID=UPI001604C404|nr:phenolphthiocerol synthesis polyketide synthase type I Pks15/1 [Folsomia candida]
MGGDIGSQMWVTYAGDDTEAMKCIGLGRSLKQTLTTRSLGVIVSDRVSKAMGELLESEFQCCRRISSERRSEDGKNLEFRSLAKLHAQQIPQLKCSVFLDCNCLVLKNCDSIFRQNGVQWVNANRAPYAAIVIDSKFGNKTGHGNMTNMIVEIENDKNFAKKSIIELEEIYGRLIYCIESDVSSAYPQPCGGDDVKMAWFPNSGHPMGTTCKTKESFQSELTEYWNSLVLSSTSYGTLREPLSNKNHQLSTSLLNDSIAIVGMAGRYPGANNMDEFWSLLENGRDGMSRVPEWRWTNENAVIMMDDVRKTEAGFLSCPVDKFDAKFFTTNQSDLGYLDPQQRLALKVVWEALENACIDPAKLRNTLTGVFGGWWRTDFKEMLHFQGINGTDFLRVYMGNALGPLTARISHFFDLIGPALSTESACSTSIAGVDMACDSLKNENCDYAIAVGVNLLLHPFPPADGAMEGILSPDGRCKTFDSTANGFGRSEGVGALILKRFPDAISAGDRIWGLIRGSAIVQEGSSRSMGRPTVAVEAKAMQLALDRAGVDPNDIKFVETHGTGTPVGDPIEVAAIAQVYGGRNVDDPLIIGSVKTNIGHTESVCGIASIQKTVLSMKYNLIPKHLHLKDLHPDIDIASIPAIIPIENVPWPSGGNSTPRIAGVNSFGFTGAQAHVIVQEPPEIHCNDFQDLRDTRELRMLTFSAKTETSLTEQIRAYSTYLNDCNSNLNDIEYSMHIGRSHFPLRQVALGSTKAELIDAMKSFKAASPSSKVIKKCFLFTGQGSQYILMGRQLYDTSVIFRSNFDSVEAILIHKYGFSIKQSLWNSDGDDFNLKSTTASQTSIFCIEICLLRVWQSWGITPDAVLGHSLGEFAAMVAAGMLTVEDALKLVVTRSKLIDVLPSSSMLVVATSLHSVLSYLEKAGMQKDGTHCLDIAAVNSIGQTVVAGDTKLIDGFREFCVNNGVVTHKLDSQHAFHSRHMDGMLKKYEEVAAGVEFQPSQITYISAVEGKPISIIDVNYLLRHTRERVNFLDATQHAINEGYNLFLELGPHPVLCPLVLINGDELTSELRVLPSIRKNAPDWSTILSSFAQLYSLGTWVNWENFHRFSAAKKIDLPGYVFEEKSHWMTLQDKGSYPFHPLLGSYFPNPSENTIFESNVNVQRLPFLRDHVIIDKIIFPCAGYVDMCMTAGFADVKCEEGAYIRPTCPIAVTNFEISTPVCLSESQGTDFQVVVSKNNEGDVVSTIYSRLHLEKSKFKWVKNASARFDANPSPADPNILNFAEIRSMISEPVKLYYDYKELFEASELRLGPSCQTVSSEGWKHPENDSEYLFPFKCYETQDDLDRFIIHPWIIDALIQAKSYILAYRRRNEMTKTKLLVPVQIEKFVWWNHSASSGYILIKLNNNNNEAHMYDDTGRLMASLIGLEIVQASLQSIMALIDSHRSLYPMMAECVWNETMGPADRRISDIERGTISLRRIVESVPVCTKFTEAEESFCNSLKESTCLYMLKALIDLGINDYTSFSWPNITEKLKVVKNFSNFLRYILLELVHDGYFELQVGQRSGDQVVCFIPQQCHQAQQLEYICTRISKLEDTVLATHPELANGDIKNAKKVWANLAKILTGEISLLDLLDDMPEDKPGEGLEEISNTRSLLTTKRETLNPLTFALLGNLSQLGTKPVVRILEVGSGEGGVGSGTIQLIKNVTDIGVACFDYTYTDLSSVCLNKGKELFEGTEISPNFAVLDINEDPSSQGFIPQQYDVILASWVLRASKDLQKSLNNLILLLKPHGYLILDELVKPCREVNLTYGGLDRFWIFEDLARRPWNCELALEGWRDLLQTSGFSEIVEVETYGGFNALIMAKLGSKTACSVINSGPIIASLGPTWLLFGDHEEGSLTLKIKQRLLNIGQNCVIIVRDDVTPDTNSNICKYIAAHTDSIVGIIFMWGMEPGLSYRQICEPFLYICKHLAETSIPNPPKLITVTCGCMCTSSNDCMTSIPDSSPIVTMVQVLGNENNDYRCKAVDVDYSENVEDEIFSELFHWDSETMVAYRRGKRCVPRLVNYKVKNTSIEIPRTDKTKLVIPPTFDIADLHFAALKTEPLTEGQVEVEIKSYSINFLDVLMVTKPDPAFDSINQLGIDIAGVITKVGPGCKTSKVGDRVTVLRRTGDPLPSHFNALEEFVLPIPDFMTYNDASTFPLSALTVLYALSYLYKTSKEDILLIHTASGGVGLIAIQLAQQIGCTIIVTAGSERKRNYLKTLGLKYVFNSRTTEYQYDIRASLHGRGVSVVLNSLTGTGFKEATLSVCDHGATFIEMSKINIWSKREVQELREDIRYEIIDVSALPLSDLRPITDDLRTQFTGGLGDKRCPLPLPYTCFESSRIKEALEYVENVKHVGKVVITMPELNKNGIPSYKMFYDEATYLITGGLGGIGLEVAKWMLNSGAKKLILIGRSSPTPEVSHSLNNLRQDGITITVRQCDVSDFEQLQVLIREVPGNYPIRGIIHAAGVLDDGLLESQTWETFENVYKAKVRGGWNLHMASLQLKFPLEHFVVFSSITATLAAPGQCNYASANYYLDSLINYRNCLGLPGLTINWGQWGTVGMAADTKHAFIKPFTVHQGIAALEDAMKSHKTQIIPYEGDMGSAKKVLASARGLLSNIMDSSEASVLQIDGEQFWIEYDLATGVAERMDILSKYIKQIIRITLKLNESEKIDDHANFQDLGLDSLMMIEMKNGLQSSVGKRVKISISSVKDCKTVAELSTRLVDLISGNKPMDILTRDQLKDLVYNDATLPDNIQVDSDLALTLCPITKVATVLITGATGTLGPYILRDLRHQYPSIQKVYCLMRPNSLLSTDDRFYRYLEEKNLLSRQELENWVETIPGDVGKELMGMNPTTYSKISSEVEAVFNLAVSPAQPETYNDTKSLHSSRMVNVQGFKFVLEFAVSNRLKYIYQGSTIATEQELDKDEIYKETWPSLNQIDQFPDSAYIISKLIADNLAEQAVNRGVPCKVFRMPNIGGDSQIGGNVPLESFQIMRFLTYMQLEVMAAVNVPLCMMPVDLCAEYSLRLFFMEDAPYEMYNVINPELGDEREFDELAKELGVNVDVLEPDEFLRRAVHLKDNSPMKEVINQVIEYERDHVTVVEEPPASYVAFLSGKKDVAWSKKLARFIPDIYPSKIMPSWDILRNDLTMAKKTGIFDKYGINYVK